MSKTRKIFNIIIISVAAISLLFTGFICGIRIAGYTPVSVYTDAMAEIYPKGSLIIVGKVDCASLEEKDIITYMYADTLPLTQRISEIYHDDGYAVTKGDSFAMSDGAPVYFRNIIGVPVASIPFVGGIASFASSGKGIAVSIVFLIFAVIWILYPVMNKNNKSKNRKKKKQEKRK